MKRTIFVAVLAIVFSAQVHANDIDPVKKKLIDELLEQTGQSAAAVGMQFSQMFNQQVAAMLRQSNPDIPPRALLIAEEEVNAVITEEFEIQGSFLQAIYPIYSRHFTADELRLLIEFNNTDLGKKLLRAMPQITQEGMQAGQAIGQRIGPEIQRRILLRYEDEGIE